MSEGRLIRPTSYLETLMHLLNGSIGTGLLAMGDAFKNSGLLLGTVLMVVLGFICVTAAHQLINAADYVKEALTLDELPDYPKTVELVYATGSEKIQKCGPLLRMIVYICLCLTQLGFCCVYIVFAASSFDQVLKAHNIFWNIHILMLIVIIPVTLLSLLRNLKRLAPVSMLVNVLLLFSTFCCVYYASIDLPPIKDRRLLTDVKRLPLFFGTAIFAMAIIGLILTLKSEMAHPEQFSSIFGVLNVGATIFTSLYILMGFLGYLKWGDDIQGSVTFHLDENELFPQCIRIATGTAIMLTYPLQFYPAFTIVWTSLYSKYGPFERPLRVEICLRVALVILTLIMAEAIPFIELLISLVGAFSTTLLFLLIPPILDYVVCVGTSKITVWILIKDSCIFIVGLLGTVTGTYTSVYSIVMTFRNASQSTV